MNPIDSRAIYCATFELTIGKKVAKQLYGFGPYYNPVGIIMSKIKVSIRDNLGKNESYDIPGLIILPKHRV